MTMTLGTLDYGPMFASGGTPAMVTLTLPGAWLEVAPTGRVFKRKLKRWFDRLDRVWGSTPLTWKLEFQRRGAPHVHLFMVIPSGSRRCRCRLCGRRADPLAFREWLSHSWAAILAHSDPDEYQRGLRAGTGIDYREGLRASDPKRLAVYFAKHGGAAGGKEYQHVVPQEWQADEDGQVIEGAHPGRFWGYRHLSQVWAGVDVPPPVAVTAARTLRRWSSRTVLTFPGQRYPHRVGKRRGRKRLATGAGFVMPNDGALLLSQLARYLNIAHPDYG
jgi:hypothetical protein